MDDERLRLLIYRAFADHGRPPIIDALAGELGIATDDVRAGLARLDRQRHLVLDADGAIVMAHPFAAVPLGFSVMGYSTLWWGGCAWDSFAVPHLLNDEPTVLVATTCPGCGDALAWNVGRQAPPRGQQVAHFLVPAAQMWDDIVRTCGHQRLFCSARCVDTWLARTENELGYLLDLPTLWRLAGHWYDGRLQYGYIRREPTAAKEYFRSVGLSGPFWGL